MQESEETMETQFLLSEQVYARAKVSAGWSRSSRRRGKCSTFNVEELKSGEGAQRNSKRRTEGGGKDISKKEEKVHLKPRELSRWG